MKDFFNSEEISESDSSDSDSVEFGLEEQSNTDRSSFNDSQGSQLIL